MNSSAHRRPQMLPFTAKVRTTCAQLMHTQARVQQHVVKTQHTSDHPHTPHRYNGWFSVNNSATRASLALPLGASTHTRAGHTPAARGARASSTKNFDTTLCDQTTASHTVHTWKSTLPPGLRRRCHSLWRCVWCVRSRGTHQRALCCTWCRVSTPGTTHASQLRGAVVFDK